MRCLRLFHSPRLFALVQSDNFHSVNRSANLGKHLSFEVHNVLPLQEHHGGSRAAHARCAPHPMHVILGARRTIVVLLERSEGRGWEWALDKEGGKTKE